MDAPIPPKTNPSENPEPLPQMQSGSVKSVPAPTTATCIQQELRNNRGGSLTERETGTSTAQCQPIRGFSDPTFNQLPGFTQWGLQGSIPGAGTHEKKLQCFGVGCTVASSPSTPWQGKARSSLKKWIGNPPQKGEEDSFILKGNPFT